MNDQVRKGGRWKLSSYPTEFAVTKEHLEYALTNGEKHGIWGGMSERERRRIRRLRALKRAAG